MVGSVPSFPSFSSNTKSPFPLPGKTDISSPASSIAFSSPCPHVLCLVCPASLEQSASFRQVHGGHLVTHCQPCCSPSVPPVRCVSGMTHALYQTWSMPDMHEGHSHTHTYTDHAKDQFRQVSLTWFFFFFSFFLLLSIKDKWWVMTWRTILKIISYQHMIVFGQRLEAAHLLLWCTVRWRSVCPIADFFIFCIFVTQLFILDKA